MSHNIRKIILLNIFFVFAFSLQPSALSPVYTASKGNPHVTKHVIARSEATKQSLRLLRSLRSLAMTVDNWLCPNVYAASKGNPPVAYWRFDEGGGGTAYDDTANNYDGTLNAGTAGTNTTAGQMWTRQGKMRGALEFDSNDDRVNAPTLSSMPSITITGWFKYNTAPATRYLSIITNWWGTWGKIYINTSGQLAWQWLESNDTTWHTLNSSSASAGAWHYFAVTFDKPTTTARLYLDGVQVDTETAANVERSNNSSIRIGHDQATLSGYSEGLCFDGLIDDMSIYNYARTADQILVDYNAGTAVYSGAGIDPNEGNPPIAYYKFDENTGTTAYDRSGNGNNGTLNDNTTWTYGKKGSGVIFDGNGDWVSIADSSTLDSISSTGTIEAWINLSSLPSNGLTDSNLYAIASGHTSAYLEIYNYSALTTYPRIGLWRSTPTNVWTLGATNLTGMTGQWLHIASTWDTTGAKIYLNGKLDGSDANGGVAGIVGASGFGIGRNPAVTRYFNGLIDDVKIYNYARTHAQIAYDYNKGKPIAHYKFDEAGGAISHNEYSSADTGTAPVGWWRMDNNWNDVSGNGYTGTATGNAAFSSSSKIGPYCGAFDGSGDCVGLPSFSSYIANKNQLTYEAWFKTTGLTGTYQEIIEYGVSDFAMELYSNSYDLKCIINNVYKLSYTITPNTWYHAAIVLDVPNVKLYVNGVLVSSASDAVAATTTTSSMAVGGRSGGSLSFNGFIDDVRIYNYARTAEQIYNDYKTSHGTLMGDTKFADGKVGKALELNGVNGYVLVPHSTSLNHDGNYTITAWFYLDTWTNYNAVLAKSDYPSNGPTQYQMQMSDAVNTKAIYSYGGGNGGIGTRVDSSANFCETGKWIFATITQEYNGTNTTIKFYKNGILYSSGTASGKTYNAVGNMSIGNDITDGKIDDVRIYNYVRTADQILQDYNAGMSSHSGASTGMADPWGGALPAGHWKLDENTGVLAKDASGNENNGTLTNGPTWAQGKVGSCLSFDGVNDNITIGNTGLPTGANPRTASVWVKTTQSGLGEIISYGSGNSGQAFTVGTWGAAIFVSAWASPQYTVNATVNDGNWHHIVVVFNGTNAATYMDGNFLDSRAFSINTVSGSAFIGSRIASAEYFNGRIDDVKIYNYARTPAQIAWDYNKGKPVGYWRLDEAVSGAVSTSAGAIKDDSDNNSDGTASNTTWTYAAGKFGGALNFDGNDYVSASSLTGIPQGNDTYTISAWIKPNAMGSEGIAGWGTWGTTNAVNAFRLHSGGLVNYWWGNDLTVSTADLSGAWHHVVALFDGTTRKIYVDGVLKGSDTPAGHNAVLSNFRLGSTNSGEYFNGLIDDVRIYNYARTQDQIVQDYNQGLAVKMGE